MHRALSLRLETEREEREKRVQKELITRYGRR